MSGIAHLVYMKALIISVPFYEYTDIIRSTIAEKLGIETDMLITTRAQNYFDMFLDRITSKKHSKRVNSRSQELFFQSHEGTEYDFIITIVGRGLDIGLFDSFIKSQKKAKKVLYIWDDVNRVTEFESLRHYFDVIYSIDTDDVKKYGFRFLPLFFCDEYRFREDNKVIEVFSSGGYHSNRVGIVERIRHAIGNNAKGKWDIRFVISKYEELKENIVGGKINKEYITHSTIPVSENAMLMRSAFASIDIPHPTQKGLSLRTFEALGARTKLITTNSSIKYYDFYNPSNIVIINRENPIIPDSFLDISYEPIDDTIEKKYSLENWLRVIFEGKNERYLREDNPWGL